MSHRRAADRPRRRQIQIRPSGTSTAGQILVAIAAPSSAPPVRSRPASSALRPPIARAVTQRSKRERITLPSRSGETAMNPSAPAKRIGSVRSAASATAASRMTTTPAPAHPSVEVMRVGVEVVRICGRVGRERRHKEAGRVLDREVPVRDPPVDGLLRVRLVHGRVHALDARPVPEVVDERPGAEEDGDTAGRDRDARASAHANDFRRTLRKHEHARSEQRCADEDGAL